MPARGKFISLEGGEGVGKSTQVQALAEALRRLGLDVLVTREPGGSDGAEKIRELLLTGDTSPQVVPLVAGEEIGEAGFFGRIFLGFKQLLGMA